MAVGVFSFLLLLCCSSTESFRALLAPVHSSIGCSTFLLALSTCIAGIVEIRFVEVYKIRRYFIDIICSMKEKIDEGKPKLEENHVLLNAIGVILISLAVVVPLILKWKGFRKGLAQEGKSDLF